MGGGGRGRGGCYSRIGGGRRKEGGRGGDGEALVPGEQVFWATSAVATFAITKSCRASNLSLRSSYLPSNEGGGGGGERGVD